MNAELHSGTESRLGAELQTHAKLQSGAELQIEENAHSDSEVSTYGRDAKTYERDVHSDTEAERQIRRHHPTNQIIGDRNTGHTTRSKLRSTTCLLSMKDLR